MLHRQGTRDRHRVALDDPRRATGGRRLLRRPVQLGPRDGAQTGQPGRSVPTSPIQLQYLLRHPNDLSRPFPHYSLSNQWRRIKVRERVDIPPGMVLYSFRHFFASNCLAQGIPITDVAEWMGHRNIDVTFKIYRHLMPGSISSAAQVLNQNLVLAT
ncbi:tyrosine-type recombinase/integrase [Streptomyces sp. NPDC090499]|uniref:tyrosine-type recombinase/integrase n=1 Tax=Streptomyces sp. NPDC090499 TaxID=3365965 RepID=UPI00381D3CD2